MPIRQTVTTTQTTELKLSPLLRRKLLVQLKTFAGIEEQLKALEIAKKKIKVTVEEMFTKAGEFHALQTGAKVEGYSMKYISGQSSRLDKKKLLGMGMTLAQLEDATTTTPSRPYLKITSPGDLLTPAEEE